MGGWGYTVKRTSNKPSVQLVNSVAAIFWSVWWSSFIRAILDSPFPAFTISQTTNPPTTIPFLSKSNVLIILAFWGIFFAITYVRWLTQVQSWTLETGLRDFISRSRLMAFAISTVLLIFPTVQQGFDLSPELMEYGKWISVLWPLAPLIVSLWPE